MCGLLRFASHSPQNSLGVGGCVILPCRTSVASKLQFKSIISVERISYSLNQPEEPLKPLCLLARARQLALGQGLGRNLLGATVQPRPPREVPPVAALYLQPLQRVELLRLPPLQCVLLVRLAESPVHEALPQRLPLVLHSHNSLQGPKWAEVNQTAVKIQKWAFLASRCVLVPQRLQRGQASLSNVRGWQGLHQPRGPSSPKLLPATVQLATTNRRNQAG